MTRNTIAPIALAAAVLLAAPLAMAQGRGRGRGNGHGNREGGGRLAQALDLDQSQAAQLRALRQQMREATGPARADLREARGQMRQLMQAQVPDVHTITELHERMGALRGVIRQARLDNRLAISSMLTPEQRSRMAELRSERRGQRGQRGQHGRRSGQGGRGMGQRMASELGLNQAQQEQLQALRQAAREDIEPAAQDLSALRERMQGLMASAQINQGAVRQLHQQMGVLHEVIADRRLELRFEVSGVLTPEQRSRMAELRSERRAQRRGQRGAGDGGND